MLFVRFCRENAPFGILRVISLVPESKQQLNTGLFCAPFKLRSLVEGFRGIFEPTSLGEKASSHPRKQIEQKTSLGKY